MVVLWFHVELGDGKVPGVRGDQGEGWMDGWAQAGDEEPKKLRGAKAVP